MRKADYHRALDEYRKCLTIDRELSVADPANTQAILDLSFSEGKVGLALGELGETGEALTILRKGVARQESLSSKDPNDVVLYGHLANSYTRLAHCLLQGGDAKTAVEYYRKAVAARLKLSAKNSGSNANRGALAECYANLGKALAASDRAGALAQYTNAIELLEPLSAAEVNNANYRIRLADALKNAARLDVLMASASGRNDSIRLEQWSKAQALYQRSQDLWQDLDRAGKPVDRQGMQDVARELARLQRDARSAVR